MQGHYHFESFHKQSHQSYSPCNICCNNRGFKIKSSTIDQYPECIHVFGKDIRSQRIEILKQIGAIIEKPDLYKYLTALQNLQIMANLSGVKKTKEELMRQLELLGIAERAHSKVKTFFTGDETKTGYCLCSYT